MKHYLIFSGTGNPALAQAMAQELGIELGRCVVKHFPDGELSVELLEPVRRRDVFLIQPTAPPVNDNLVELLLFADACRRSGAARLTAIVPYFGYARSDKRHGRREPIAASMVAHLLQTVSVDHVITIDLHTPQIEGFFHAAVDSLTAQPTLCGPLRQLLPAGEFVVVSPDAGRVKLATDYASRLEAPLAVLHKQRKSGHETAVTHLVGEVQGRACLIVDDMIATGGTLASSMEVLLQAGARPEFYIAATHGLFVGRAREQLDHPALRRIFVTDSIASQHADWPRLEVVSVAPLLATAIRRLRSEESLSDLF